MRKDHNAALPMMDAIKTLNSYGLEVTSGIILGLDTDSADTEQRLKDFHRRLTGADSHDQSASGACRARRYGIGSSATDA